MRLPLAHASKLSTSVDKGQGTSRYHGGVKEHTNPKLPTIKKCSALGRNFCRKFRYPNSRRCIWIGGLFWLATGLGWSFFMLGATYGHIRETVIRGDYAPYNFFTMFSDGFIGIWILVLLYLYWRQGGFRK